jgi:tricarballylate dehydrogenase
MSDAFMPSLYPPIVTNTVHELAIELGLNPETVGETVASFNAAVQDGTYDPTVLDDCRTAGLEIPKSHWARRIDTPPFMAYPLRPGITFTYRGLAVNDRAQVLAENDDAIPGLYAAGEAMAGNILGRGYLAGFGMTIGSVFGRIAGREAVKYALR